MLTESENKILMNILSGKGRKRHIFGIMLLAALFSIVLIIHFNVTNKHLSNFEKICKELHFHTAEIETKTELEKVLKSMFLDTHKEYEKAVKTFGNFIFSMRLVWSACLFFLLIINFRIITILGKIIKKLHQEKEAKRET